MAMYLPDHDSREYVWPLSQRCLLSVPEDMATTLRNDSDDNFSDDESAPLTQDIYGGR